MSEYLSVLDIDDSKDVKIKDEEARLSIGTLADLQTEDKTSVVHAINEVIGDYNNVNTRVDGVVTDLAYANTRIDSVVSSVVNVNNRVDGIASDLTGIHNDVNSLSGKIGNLASLSTTNKTNLVNAINEVNDALINLSNYDKADIRNYGGVGDGVTNDTAAFNACMADNGVVYLPIVSSSNPKNYLLDSITLSGNNSVIADKGAKIKYTGSGYLFTITGSNVAIENLTVYFTNGGSFLSIANTSNSSINEFNISNIITYNAVHFIDDSASTASYVSTYIHDVECKGQSGVCLNISHSFAFLLIENLTSDMTGKSASANYAHFVFANSQGMQLTHVEAEGGYVDGYNAQNVGFYFNNCAATWIDKCLADTCAGAGFYMESTCSYFYFSNSSASLCDGFGFLLNGSKIDMNNGYVAGRIAISGHSSGSHGINSYGTGVNINNVTVFDVDGNGIAIQSGAHLIGNCRITNCPVGVGYTTSASGYVHDCDVSGATTKISGSGSLLYKDMFDGTTLLTNVA